MSTLSTAASQLAEFLRADSPSISVYIPLHSKVENDALNALTVWTTKYQKAPASINNFYKIDFELFTYRLRELITKPFLMNQGNYGLCTMSSILYLILKERPVSIINYAMQLFTTGSGKLGDLEVKPGKTFKEQDLNKNVTVYAINQGDKKTYYILPDLLMMGALRDSQNTLPFDFDKNSASSSMVNYFSVSGYDGDIVSILKETKIFSTIIANKPKIDLTFEDFNTEIRKHKYIVIGIDTTGDATKIMNEKFFVSGKHHCVLNFNYIMPNDAAAGEYFFPFVTWGWVYINSVKQEDFNEALESYIVVD